MSTRSVASRTLLYPHGRGRTLARFRFELSEAEIYERKNNVHAAEKVRLAARKMVVSALLSRHGFACVARRMHIVTAILDRQERAAREANA